MAMEGIGIRIKMRSGAPAILFFTGLHFLIPELQLASPFSASPYSGRRARSHAALPVAVVGMFGEVSMDIEEGPLLD